MITWILDHYIATLSITVISIIACGAVAWFIPPLRRLAIEAGILIATAAAIFTRGYLAAKREDRAKQEKAVEKAKQEFDKIDARPDTDSTVDKRLRDGSF